jgi:hypothetical protein
MFRSSIPAPTSQKPAATSRWPTLRALWSTAVTIAKPKVPDALLEHRAKRSPPPSPLDQALNDLLRHENLGAEEIVAIRFSSQMLDYLLPAVEQLVERFSQYQQTGETTIPPLHNWQQFYKDGQAAVQEVYDQFGVSRLDLSKQFSEKYYEKFPIARPRRGKPPDPERLVCQLVIELCVRRYLKDVLESLGATCVVEEAEEHA